MGIVTILGQALWFILPALAPSSGAVLTGGGTPIDFGKMAKDGRPILGPGKTWRGLIGGTLTGMALGAIFNILALYVLDKPEWSFGEWGDAIPLLFFLAFGSMVGDLLGSFLKRRLGKEKGSKFPIMDQYDLLIGSLIFILIFEFSWFESQYLAGDHIFGLIFIVILIPILHRLTNIIGYKMGKKEVPW